MYRVCTQIDILCTKILRRRANEHERIYHQSDQDGCTKGPDVRAFYNTNILLF